MNKTVPLFIPMSILLFGTFISNGFCRQLKTSIDFPKVNQAVEIYLQGTEDVDLSKIKLEAEYRPNSETGFTSQVDTIIEPGKWLFTPQIAGLVLLKAIKQEDAETGKTSETIASLRLSVCYASPPLAGIFVIVFAGIILFGGIAISVRHAMISKKSPHVIDT